MTCVHMWGRPARERSLLALLLLASIAGLLFAQLQAPSKSAAVVAAPASSAPGSVAARAVRGPAEKLSVGITHTENSADSWNSPQAVARARNVIKRSVAVQNQHIMGWGADSPSLAPGSFNWDSLDQRVELMRQTGGEMVLTLCCSPDWMKGGAPGTTNWGALEQAPAPGHYADFASLAAAVAQRYPDITHFVVWNELKGFWDSARNTWDIEGYTDFYNQVYAALKAVNPAIQVGGPYVPADTWSKASRMSAPSSVRGAWGVLDERVMYAIKYWLAHMAGADFIAVDGGTDTKDAGLTTSGRRATAKFSAVTTWIRSQTSLPVWWMELYAPARKGSSKSSPAVLRTALRRLQSAQAAVALLWDPQSSGRTCNNCLWTDTRKPGGGRPTAFARVVTTFR